LVVGVDPAPSKATVAVLGTSASDVSVVEVPARKLGAWLDKLEAKHERILLTWDAPLSFDSKYGLSDRPVDKGLRAFTLQKEKEGRFGKKPRAISVLPFSGCPHWTVTCESLGMPFGAPRAHQPEGPEDLRDGLNVAEVHPAVAIGLWWLLENPEGEFPRYKKGSGIKVAKAGRNRASLVPMLKKKTGLPSRCFASADEMDASVAWALGRMWLDGKSKLAGGIEDGGYLLPSREASTYRLNEYVKAARRELRR